MRRDRFSYDRGIRKRRALSLVHLWTSGGPMKDAREEMHKIAYQASRMRSLHAALNKGRLFIRGTFPDHETFALN